jgi:hypothetical protein
MISRDGRIRPFQELENRNSGEKQGSILAWLGGGGWRFDDLDLLFDYWTWVLQMWTTASARNGELRIHLCYSRPGDCQKSAIHLF